MEKMSIKKWSVLGLVLMGASAVTAAVLPSKNNINETGALVPQSGDGAGSALIFSCRPGDGDCTLTANSDSTVNVNQGVTTFSTGAGMQTQGNTSTSNTPAVTDSQEEA